MKPWHSDSLQRPTSLFIPFSFHTLLGVRGFQIAMALLENRQEEEATCSTCVCVWGLGMTTQPWPWLREEHTLFISYLYPFHTVFMPFSYSFIPFSYPFHPFSCPCHTVDTLFIPCSRPFFHTLFIPFSRPFHALFIPFSYPVRTLSIPFHTLFMPFSYTFQTLFIPFSFPVQVFVSFLSVCFGDLAFSAVQRLKMSQPEQKLTGLPNVMRQETDSSSIHSCLVRGLPVKAQISQLFGLPARNSTFQASPGRPKQFCPLNANKLLWMDQLHKYLHFATWPRKPEAVLVTPSSQIGCR